MVQNCCANCTGSVGRFLSYVFLCKCCVCCCCCKKKQIVEENKQINLEAISKEEVYEADDGEVYEEYVGDDISIYNGSSTYGVPPASVYKQPTSCTTSGIYTSETSLHTSGSSYTSSSPNGKKEIYESKIVYRNKPELPKKRPISISQSNKTEICGNISNVHDHQNEVKLKLSCDIKGAMEIGGKQQPVKGILLIVPDEFQQRNTNTIHLRHSNSRTETLPKQHGKNIHNKAPRPLPRIHSHEGNNNEAFLTHVSEMYLHRNSSLHGETRRIPENAGYDTPKPPLPKKSQRIKDFINSADSIYENVGVKTISRNVETPRGPHIKLPGNKFYASKHTADLNEDIYEYIDPQDRYECGNERVDCEIYMSHA